MLAPIQKPGFLAVVFAAALSLPAEAQTPAQGAPAVAVPPSVFGVWIDHTGQGAVEIAPCGDRVCGHVVWIEKPVDARGVPMTDRRNPDPAKRGKPMCGVQILGDLTRGANGRYEKGWVYNPEDGTRYDVDMRLAGRDVLEVHGFLGIRLLGETFAWKRAPANLARCKA